MEFNEEEQDRKEKEELDEDKPVQGEEPKEGEQPEDDEKENKDKEKPEDHVGNLVQAQAEEKALKELEQGDQIVDSNEQSSKKDTRRIPGSDDERNTEGYENKGWFAAWLPACL